MYFYQASNRRPTLKNGKNKEFIKGLGDRICIQNKYVHAVIAGFIFFLALLVCPVCSLSGKQGYKYFFLYSEEKKKNKLSSFMKYYDIFAMDDIPVHT